MRKIEEKRGNAVDVLPTWDDLVDDESRQGVPLERVPVFFSIII
jgi:hypothetical protein